VTYLVCLYCLIIVSSDTFINTACVTIMKTRQGECAISLYDFIFRKFNPRYASFWRNMWCWHVSTFMKQSLQCDIHILFVLLILVELSTTTVSEKTILLWAMSAGTTTYFCCMLNDFINLISFSTRRNMQFFIFFRNRLSSYDIICIGSMRVKCVSVFANIKRLLILYQKHIYIYTGTSIFK
jgi:hypothetical protein